MLDHPWIKFRKVKEVTGPPPPPPPHTHTIILKKRQNLPLRHQSIRWDLKPWFRLHMTLTVGGSLNKKQQLTVDLDPLTWSTCAVNVQLQAFPSEDGWGASSLSFFVCRQCWPRSGPTDPNCLKLWRYFWYFFHIHFLETKAPIRPAVRRLVWAFVVPMYQRRIFRDKVHTIFKNSKLNVKIYTRINPRR